MCRRLIVSKTRVLPTLCWLAMDLPLGGREDDKFRSGSWHHPFHAIKFEHMVSRRLPLYRVKGDH